MFAARHRGEKLHSGKAKVVYATSSPGQCLIDFTDTATALDGDKVGSITSKGELNAEITAHLFQVLAERGIPNHLIRQVGPTTLLVTHLDIIPVEVVVRNIAAGSMSRRLGMQEGTILRRPVLEFYLKDDALKDPLINRYHALAMNLATSSDLSFMEEEAWRINAVLKEFLAPCGLDLVDFKLEFGRAGDRILLGDEISPDTCRLWDSRTGSRLDKDLFRRDLGGEHQAYTEVLNRIRKGRGSNVQG